VGSFSDALTKRGRKHLYELIQQVKYADRAVLLFIIMRTDVNLVTPADSGQIQGRFSGCRVWRLLREAVKEGVEVLAYRAKL